ncbi:hypothetical protein PIB30_071045, partial [Stylosanthes scabra]|nr:hypothetical protein [Stylosanthes scabra]
ATFCLAKLLLGDLYHGLGQMVDQLRAGETSLRSGGPLWIAQLWVNAVFEKFMVLNRAHVKVKLPIEGYRLAHLEPNFNVKGGEVIDYFWFVFTKLLKSRTFGRT